jgi:vacuolar-type H+-ATPase subunit E/Vma4
VDPVTALGERIRELARQSGEEVLRAKQQEAGRLVAKARERAEAECRAELAAARKKIDQQIERELQNARLEARARLARFRWALLDDILEEAVRQIGLLREADPASYTAALGRFVEDARRYLAAPRVLVKGNARDLGLLRRYLEQVPGAAPQDRALDFVEADVASGIQVGTPTWDLVADQSIDRRRECLDQELRLAAAEILFEGGSGAAP